MSHVISLGTVGREQVALAGGKGANLGELIMAGIDVPDGFVITTNGYLAALGAAGLTTPDETEDDPVGFRRQLSTAPIPPELSSAIAAAYLDLGGGPVAVRSSATAEDLPGATFAGQQDTELNVVGADLVLDAVRRCWASLWSERAVAYRRRRRIPPEDVRIAVVVQRMVPADVAGVMFTANPVTGARDQVVVDAGSGLGEAVVSGAVTPDHYVLDKAGALRKLDLGRGEVVITGRTGGGLDRSSGSPSTGRLLDDRTLRELAGIGAAVSAHFGAPQDIEWAIAESRIWVVQARPMTALPPPPVRLSRFQRTLAGVVVEMLPVRPYPIDMTTWVPYGPVGGMSRITGFVGIRGVFDGLFVEEDGVVVRFVPPSPRPTPRVLLAPWRLVSRARRYHPDRWREDPRYLAFRADVAALAKREPSALGWAELVGLPRQALRRVMTIFDLRIDYLPGMAMALARLFVALRVLRRGQLFWSLIGGAPTLTQQANRELDQLADQVRDQPDLAAAIADHGSAGLSAFPEFRAAFAAYLRTYGHRETASPILVTQPTWTERPGMVLDLVASLAAGPARTAPGANRAMGLLLDHPLLWNRRLRELVERWVAAARSGFAVREDTHAEFIRPLPVLRGALLEIGARLVGAGVLDEPEDVYHLRLDELEGISDLEALRADDRVRLRNAMRARALKREELTGVPLIDPTLVYGVPPVEGALVRGTPAGSGRATGPVRVVRGPEDFATLRPGEVLVCPYTNPAWTSLFGRAVAVVVDSGGLGSHAAIVAREYGIPAIMGTVDGTRLLVDGQLVTVDGGAGIVVAADVPGGRG